MAKPFSSLKNSGNFRLIKSIEAANKMMDYHNKVSLVYLLESINETEFTPYKTVAVKIFNPAIFDKAIRLAAAGRSAL